MSGCIKEWRVMKIAHTFQFTSNKVSFIFALPLTGTLCIVYTQYSLWSALLRVCYSWVWISCHGRLGKERQMIERCRKLCQNAAIDRIALANFRCFFPYRFRQFKCFVLAARNGVSCRRLTLLFLPCLLQWPTFISFCRTKTKKTKKNVSEPPLYMHCFNQTGKRKKKQPKQIENSFHKFNENVRKSLVKKSMFFN